MNTKKCEPLFTLEIQQQKLHYSQNILPRFCFLACIFLRAAEFLTVVSALEQHLGIFLATPIMNKQRSKGIDMAHSHLFKALMSSWAILTAFSTPSQHYEAQEQSKPGQRLQGA